MTNSEECSQNLERDRLKGINQFLQRRLKENQMAPRTSTPKQLNSKVEIYNKENVFNHETAFSLTSTPKLGSEISSSERKKCDRVPCGEGAIKKAKLSETPRLQTVKRLNKSESDYEQLTGLKNSRSRRRLNKSTIIKGDVGEDWCGLELSNLNASPIQVGCVRSTDKASSRGREDVSSGSSTLDDYGNKMSISTTDFAKHYSMRRYDRMASSQSSQSRLATPYQPNSIKPASHQNQRIDSKPCLWEQQMMQRQMLKNSFMYGNSTQTKECKTMTRGFQDASKQFPSGHMYERPTYPRPIDDGFIDDGFLSPHLAVLVQGTDSEDISLTENIHEKELMPEDKSWEWDETQSLDQLSNSNSLVGEMRKQFATLVFCDHCQVTLLSSETNEDQLTQTFQRKAEKLKKE